MDTKTNRRNAHNEIDHIFKELLPFHGMTERLEQKEEYLPFLSTILIADSTVVQPLRAVIRKGKSHYICDERLERRLKQMNLEKKNKKAGEALFALWKCLDMEGVPHLSSYDRERVCVPKTCDCRREGCRYLSLVDACDIGQHSFQICNHNLLLADAIHRKVGHRAILPDGCAVIIGEAHKLQEVARQMFRISLGAKEIQELVQSLRREKYLLAAESLEELFAPFLGKLDTEECSADECIRLLLVPEQGLQTIRNHLHGDIASPTRKALEQLASAVALFLESSSNMVFYAEKGRLYATILDLTSQLRFVLWSQEHPILLTSGTLAVGADFRRFKEESGLLTDNRVTKAVSFSPLAF